MSILTGRRRGLLILAGLVVVPMIALAPQASAHADLVSSSPPAGTRLTTEPTQATVIFSEGVDASLSTIKVIGPDGRRLDTGPARPEGSQTLAVTLRGDNTHGTYVLDWRTVATDDGHVTSGAFSFVVGRPSALPVVMTQTAGAGGPATATLDLVTWLSFLGFALFAGFLAVRFCCLPAKARTIAPTWPAVSGWLLLFCATIAELLLYGPYATGDPLTQAFSPNLLAVTLSTMVGRALVVRAGILVLVAILGDWVLTRTSTRWGLPAAVVVVLALAATWSATSHASVGGQVPLSVSLTTVHVTAMGAWAGGLVTALASLRPITRPSTRPAGITAQAAGGEPGSVAVALATEPAPTTGPPLYLTRFSRLALCCVIALIGTGLYQAVREVGGFGELVGTNYGALLIGKVCLLGAILCVASRSRRVVVRRLGTSLAGLLHTMFVEVVGLVVLLAVTTVLIGTEPPASRPDAAAPLASISTAGHSEGAPR